MSDDRTVHGRGREADVVIGPNARRGRVGDSARVTGLARVTGSAVVIGSALVGGWALVGGRARVAGSAQVESNDDIAWVDRVGSGQSMTLHRVADGWRINAGCVHFEAPTVAEVCAAVVDSAAKELAHPEHWADGTDEDRARWVDQVAAALEYLRSMVAKL